MRFVLAAIAALALAQPTLANDDPFAGQPRASLHVRIELAGRARVNFPNGVEWAAIEAWRTLELDFGLVDVSNDGVPIVGGVPAGAVPREAQALEAKIQACGENQKCLAEAMMEFAQGAQAEGGRNPFEAMLGLQPGRYRNFVADRNGVCAKGTLVVQDVLSGVLIPPPNPAIAYRFIRNGSLTLPADGDGAMDAACSVEISLDTVAGTMSLRLPAAKLDVPVMMGPTAFTNERSTPLIEGAQSIELIDQPAGRDGIWTGIAEVEVGSASHNSGQVAAPLKGRVTWSFSDR